MRRAAHMMGRTYFLAGEVVGNREIGRKLGFPTANIEWDKQVALPRAGVYASIAEIDGRCCKAVTNVGSNPTVQGDKISIETHLLEEGGNLYGKLLTVRFVEFLRGEICFENTEKLKAQIAADKENAARILKD